jgi:hypothetical protein
MHPPHIFNEFVRAVLNGGAVALGLVRVAEVQQVPDGPIHVEEAHLAAHGLHPLQTVDLVVRRAAGEGVIQRPGFPAQGHHDG